MGRVIAVIRYLDRDGRPARTRCDVVAMVRIYRTGLFAVSWQLYHARALPALRRSGAVSLGVEFYPHSLIGQGRAPTRRQAIITTNLLTIRTFHVEHQRSNRV